MNAEQLAGFFHDTYERLAPAFGYKTRKASRVPFSQIPSRNRSLMVAVCQNVLNALQSKESPATGEERTHGAKPVETTDSGKPTDNNASAEICE